jgi:hypothetical protein
LDFEFQVSSNGDFSLLVAGRTGGSGAGPAGRTGGAFELPADGKGKSGHHPMNFFALTFGAGDFFRGIQYQFFKFALALAAMILVNRHFTNSF